MDASWRKSSYSGGNGGGCIEVASPGDAVVVRDTKQNAAGPVLRFGPGAWRRFAESVKRSLGRTVPGRVPVLAGDVSVMGGGVPFL